MTIHYFAPTPADIKAAKDSNCPLATPMDSRDCQGRACGSWDTATDNPCPGHRGFKDYGVSAVMTRLQPRAVQPGKV